MAKRVGVVILGGGVVGSAVAERLIADRQALASRTGVDVDVRSVVVRDPAKPRSRNIPSGLFTTDRSRAIGDADAQIVVELIGGTDVARDAILAALGSGKDVVTANKALLALQGPEVFAAARANHRCIAFEAAVCGGIPLIESVRRGLIANDVDAIFGILNGTCNYILCRMLDEEISYAEVLSDAQRLGYAETDPTLDVEGIDSAHKLTILAALATRTACDFREISHRGITDIEVTDLLAGHELGFVCKLLAIARQHDDGLELSVQPTFISHNHPLASVSGPFNAVSIYGDSAGHTLLYGRGAGGGPTASAVIADIIDVAIGNSARSFEAYSVLPDITPAALYGNRSTKESAYYLRVGLIDQPGGMASVATALGNERISIASLVQRQAHESHADDAVPVVVVTHPAEQQRMDAAIKTIGALSSVMGKIVCIPIMDEHVEVNGAAD